MLLEDSDVDEDNDATPEDWVLAYHNGDTRQWSVHDEDLPDGRPFAIAADGDGVCGDVDICPGHDDSIDTDQDGIPDGCDDCPNDPDRKRDG